MEDIIKKIAKIQLDSWNRILKKKAFSKSELFLLNQFDNGLLDAENLASNKIKVYEGLMKYPNHIGLVDNDELSIIMHILFRMESEWILINQSGVYKLWSKLFEIQENRQPKVKLNMKIIYGNN